MITEKLIPYVLGAVLLSGSLFGAYKYVEKQGYDKAQVECTQKFDKYQKEVDARLASIQTNIFNLTGELTTNNSALSSDINDIVKRLKGLKPTTIVKEGKCVPTKEFVDSLNEAIDRANRR